MLVPTPPLASQTVRAGEFFREVLPWLLVLLGMVIVGAVILFIIRRTVTPGNSNGDPGFTLHDLRRLHETGELSDEEFERARESMISRVKAHTSGNDSTTDAQPTKTD